MKKTASILLIILLGTVSLLFFAACSDSGTAGRATSYVHISVNSSASGSGNASIEMVADGKNTIMQINPLNEEGGLLLWENTLVGKKLDNALLVLLDTMAQTGYISTSTQNINNVVFINVISLTQPLQKEITSKMIAKGNDFFEKNGLFSIVVKAPLEGVITNGEQARTFEKFREDLKISDIATVEKLALILKVMDYDPSLSFSETYKMSELDLMTRLNSSMAYLSTLASREQKRNYINEVKELKLELEEQVINFFSSSYNTIFNNEPDLEELFGEEIPQNVTHRALFDKINELKEEYWIIEKSELKALQDKIVKWQRVLNKYDENLKRQYSFELNDFYVDYLEGVEAIRQEYSLNTTMPNYANAVLQKKNTHLQAYNDRKLYAGLNSNFKREYKVWQPFKEDDIKSYLLGNTKTTQYKTQIKNEFDDILKTVNYFSRKLPSGGWGDSSGITTSP